MIGDYPNAPALANHQALPDKNQGICFFNESFADDIFDA